MTIEEIVKQKDKINKIKADLKRPIDFDKLIKNGILSKKGTWYEVKNLKRLPRYARYQINEMTVGDRY